MIMPSILLSLRVTIGKHKTFAITKINTTLLETGEWTPEEANEYAWSVIKSDMGCDGVFAWLHDWLGAPETEGPHMLLTEVKVTGEPGDYTTTYADKRWSQCKVGASA